MPGTGPEGIPFAQHVYVYGDMTTTMCHEAPEPGRICLWGLAPKASDGMGNDYAFWGAGMGVQLAPRADDDSEIPFDATQVGIAGFSYRIELNEPHLAMRLAVTQVNTEAVLFQDQGFVHAKGGVGAEGDLRESGTVVVMFDELSLPEWADFDGDPNTQDYLDYTFDPTQLSSIQFQVVTEPELEAPYDFCISEITWLDADGAEVLPPAGG